MPNVAYALNTVVAFALIVLNASPRSALAQSGGPLSCSRPVSISDDIAPFSAFPKIAADRFGRLHMIWSSGMAEGRSEEQVATDTIFLATFFDGRWDQPTDIFADNTYASADDIAVLADDTLLVSWRTPSGLKLSRAVLDSARSPQGWTTRIVSFGNIASSNMLVDQKGRIHLAYAVSDPLHDEGRLGYVWSDDAGQTWSTPTEFAFVDPRTQINTGIRIYTTGDGVLNLSWHNAKTKDGWLPSGVWYASSGNGGETWSDPQEVFSGGRAAYPYFSAGAGPNSIYMTWLRGVGYDDSKYLRYSSDAGATWTEPQLVFRNLAGMNGGMPIVVDSAGVEHWIMSGDKLKTQIWHSTHSATTPWSNPDVISGDLSDSEFPQAVVMGGNQLHIVWNDFVKDDIFHVICSLEAPVAPFQPKQTTLGQVKTTPEQTKLSPEKAPALQSRDRPELQRPPTDVLLNDGTPTGNSTGQTLAMAMLPVAALIGLAFVWQLRRKP